MKQKIKICLILFFIAFATITICSCNSFLYGFNDWVDLNWFITMGNGVRTGKVIYRDMFEQKGPLLYFVFAFLTIFKNPYIAVYALEIVCAFAFLLVGYNILCKWYESKISVLFCVIVAVITYTSGAFVTGGGAVEEFGLPIIAYFLLFYLNSYLDRKRCSIKNSIFVGLMMATLFWVKYTMCIFPIIIMVCWLILTLKRKDYSQLKYILFMALGFAIVSALVLAYFVVNHATSDLFESYFFTNMTSYNNVSVLYTIWIVINNIFLFTFAIFGVAYAFLKKHLWLGMIFIVYILLTVLTCNYIYYFMTLAIFMPFGVMFLFEIFDKIFIKKHFKVICTLTIFLCAICCALFNNSKTEMFVSKDKYVQIQVAKRIDEFGYENPSLLCYKMIDYGFYNACNIVPSTRFYALNNFSEEDFPEMYEAFDEAVSEQVVDFVIAFEQDYESSSIFDGKYELVDHFSYTNVEDLIAKELRFVLLKKI